MLAKLAPHNLNSKAKVSCHVCLRKALPFKLFIDDLSPYVLRCHTFISADNC